MTSLIEQVRKEKTSCYNRLRSINEDAEFVRYIVEEFATLPVIANQRCGAWYVDPANSRFSNEWAYFKSTDGHHGRWSFNLRRANLHLLSLIDFSGGIIIVDSTRRGKRYPDALSKTVPIWCAVINRALRKLHPESCSSWDDALYTSPRAVSPSEHAQIADLIDSWALELSSSTFDLHRMSKPLRPFWLSPDSAALPRIPLSSPYLPVICVSASKLVEGDGIERRSGFVYVQGSGDDHELWSQGLTPSMFWDHRQRLLAASPTELELLIARILKEAPTSDSMARLESSASFPIARVGGGILIHPSFGDESRMPDHEPCIIISRQPHSTSGALSLSPSAHAFDPPPESPHTLRLFTSSIHSKRRDLVQFFSRMNLDTAVNFARSHLPFSMDRPLNIMSVPGCEDELIGLAIVLLQALFNDSGDARMDPATPETGSAGLNVSKETLRMRLQWIQASAPTMNPSRASLRLVNTYFMSR